MITAQYEIDNQHEEERKRGKGGHGRRHGQGQRRMNQQLQEPLRTTYLAVRNLKQIVMENWSLIQNQPLLKIIYKKPPIISHKRGKSLKDTLVQAKI